MTPLFGSVLIFLGAVAAICASGIVDAAVKTGDRFKAGVGMVLFSTGQVVIACTIMALIRG